MATMSISVQAVSFAWTSASPISFGGAVLGSSGDFTAYLIDLGSGTWSSYLAGISAETALFDDQVDSSGVRITGGTNIGKISGKTYGLNGNQGNVYGVIVAHTDNNGDTWYNFSDYYTVANILDNVQGDAFTAEFISFTGKTTVDDIKTVGTSGWYRVVPVPEPATAALALAGLALLIRRRK